MLSLEQQDAIGALMKECRLKFIEKWIVYEKEREQVANPTMCLPCFPATTLVTPTVVPAPRSS